MHSITFLLYITSIFCEDIYVRTSRKLSRHNSDSKATDSKQRNQSIHFLNATLYNVYYVDIWLNDGLGPSACWASGFKSRRRHKCLSFANIVCCDGPIPRPEESYRLCVIWKAQEWGGRGPGRAVTTQKEYMNMYNCYSQRLWGESSCKVFAGKFCKGL
jgi:hypothetical protein